MATRSGRPRGRSQSSPQRAASPSQRARTMPAGGRTGAVRLGGDRVEGRRAVRELLAAGRRRVRTVWIARGREPSPLLAEIEELASRGGVPVRLVDAERLQREAGTDAPQGVVAVAEPVIAADLDDLLRAPAALLVALDGVTDPRNLGAVVRSAETAGATGVVLERRRSPWLTPAAVKAAAGAVEYVPIALVPGIATALDRASRAGVWTVALDSGGSTTVDELSIADRPLVLVLGAEGRGLSRLVRERSDVVARIPLRGHLDSLNVSAAAAVACHQIARLRET